MSVALAIAAPLSAQVVVDVTRTNSFQAYAAAFYMVEKMATVTRVLLNGPPAEVALPHVFAQCDQPTINLLTGNFASPGGGNQ